MSRFFVKRSDAEQVTPTRGQTLADIVAQKVSADPKLTWRDVAMYNWGTIEPVELNRALVEVVGCSEVKEDPTQSVLDPDLGTTKKVLIPKQWSKKDLPLEKTHTIKAVRRAPAPAVAITALSKWFIPEAEICTIDYRLEGIAARADVVDLEVRASNYCKATPTVDGDYVTYAFASSTVPIFEKRGLPQKAPNPASAYNYTGWKGESEATEGVLKPRAPAKRYINVAFSPYTVQLRFYKDSADRNVSITLEPFWPRWDKPVNGTIVDDSLVVKWKIENDTSSKLKLGQIVFWDKSDRPVFAAGLDETALKSGTFDWKAKGKTIVRPENMPYRVQIQAHSDTDEAKGLALAVAHTEVRLWVHKDTGTKDDPVKDEKQSLAFALAPYRPETTALTAGTVEWYKLKLAESGFHPGPINAVDETGPAATALTEYQDAYEKHVKAVSVKYYVDKFVDWATQAKTATTDAQTDVTTAQTSITTAQTDAGTAKTHAETAATNAATAATSIAQAFHDVKSAYDGRHSVFVAKATVATRIATAKGTLATALTDATAARDAANTAKTSIATAKTSAGTAKTDAATATVAASAADGKAANKVATATAWATAAKNEATAAPSPGALVTKLGEADTTGGTAKPKATTSATDSKEMATAAKKTADDAVPAETHGTSSYDKWNAIVTLINGAAAALATVGSEDLTTAKGGMELAKNQAGPAKTASDTAKTAVDTLKTSADAAVTRATTAKASADAAATDTNTLKTKADEAKVLSDAEETTRKNARNTKGTAVVATAGTSPLYTALAELQRSYPKNDAAPFVRLPADGKKSADTQTTLARLVGDERPMFGTPTTFADHTRVQAGPILPDKTKSLIVWVDDRHSYTQGATDPNHAMAMLDYRGPMDIGDERVKRDATSISRPWLPVEVGIPLLKKTDPLEQTGAAPAVTDAMRRAIGPLRVDFSFEELPPELDVIPMTTDVEDTAAKALYQKAKAVYDKGVEAFKASKEAVAATTESERKATASKTKLTAAAVPITAAVPHGVNALALAETMLTRAETALTKAGTAVGGSRALKREAKTAIDDVVAAIALVGPAVATVDNDRAPIQTKLTPAATAAAAAETEAGDGKAAGKVSTAKTKTDAFKTEADTAPSPLPVKNAVDAAVLRGPTAVTSATTAKTKTASTNTAFTIFDSVQLSSVATLVTAANAALSNADAAAKQAQKRAGKNDAVATAQSARDLAVVARNAVRDLKNRVDAMKANIDQLVVDATQAATDALTAKTDAKALYDDVLAAARLAEAELKTQSENPKRQDQDNHRSRKYLEEILSERGKGKKVGAALYTNCPALVGGVDRGGIRPDNLDLYYKAPFSIDKDTSLRPWLSIDDQANKVVCALVHDDLGQDQAKVHETHLGKAGLYMRPSRIAGDGYRFRARVGFKPLPGGGDKSPANYAVLEKRYPQLPDSWSAAMRVWRKTSFRGYLDWLPAAIPGWQDAMDKARDLYKHAHVFFIHEGPHRDTPQSFKIIDTATPANGLITPAEYATCIDTSLNVVGSAFQGKSAEYTQGYIWPYLNVVGYGMDASPVDLATYVKNLSKIGGISWNKFRDALLHKLVEAIEAKHGRLRGHILVEFESSPDLVIFEYKCPSCNHKYSDIVNNPGGTVTAIRGKNYKITESVSTWNCTNGCDDGATPPNPIKYQKTADSIYSGGFPLNACGLALGCSWLFVPRLPETWAHEMGHHRHFEHAQAYAGNDDPAPGFKNALHDSEANPHQAGADKPHQKAWDRFCVMSYDKGAPRRFCGKCILRNRGWAVEDITNPAGATQDH